MINYSASIIAAATKYGVDPNLALAVAQAESSMNPSAISPKGATGLFQLLPSSFPGVNINDPLTNIDSGVDYLSELLDKYDGDVSLALAAYNAGMGNVAKYGGVPPFAETQNYISKILGMLGLSSSDASVASIDDSGDSSDGTVGSADLLTIALVAGVGIAGYLLVR
jgi:soluble lytic murein transglycosylase-like protein